MKLRFHGLLERRVGVHSRVPFVRQTRDSQALATNDGMDGARQTTRDNGRLHLPKPTSAGHNCSDAPFFFAPDFFVALRVSLFAPPHLSRQKLLWR